MKVYVLKFIDFDYHRFTCVFGVYSTPEKAKEAARELNINSDYPRDYPIHQYQGEDSTELLGSDYDHWQIEEFEIETK